MAMAGEQTETTLPPHQSLHSPPPDSQLSRDHAPSAPPPNYPTSETAMFKKVVASGCTVKSQQRGEPDSSEAELYHILHNILIQKPGAFLSRFGKYLDEADLRNFDPLLESSFEVRYRVGELERVLHQSSKSRMKTIKNRRYKYLQKLMGESDYFSDEMMRQRDPLLFEYYIGQFMSEDEKLEMEANNKSEMKLSSMILKNMEVDQRTELLRQQQSREHDQLEETDSSDDDDDDLEEMGRSENIGRTLVPMKLSSDLVMAEREKKMLRGEFLTAMQNSFLDGKDKDFDYSVVDQNENYDSLEMKQIDAEDDYFDSEEPSWCKEDPPTEISHDGMELGATEECERN